MSLDRVAGARGVKPAAVAATTPAVLRPQAPLQQAAGDAVRRDPPSGLGLDSSSVRLALMQRLRAAGLRHESVLAAMGQVPRHLFVDTALAIQAYEDTSLPIGHGQTISKPSVVGRMVELLFETAAAVARNNLGNVLEIGTGCGYQAAVLARVSRRIVSIERLKPLYEKARDNLASHRSGTGGADLRLVYGDGRLGHAPNTPYDSIIAAAGGDDIPPAWLEQLAIGGRLVAPLHDAVKGHQSLVVVDRSERGFHHSIHETVHFVPLKSGIS